jgi:hydrogenase maturation protease
MNNSGCTTMVIGVGNRFRSDDAVGLVVADRLKTRREGLRVVAHSGDLLGLRDAWRGAEVVVLVDALSSADAPGTIRRFDVRDTPLPNGAFRGSTHAFGIADVVALARSTGALPPRVIVYGVVGGCFDHGDDLSEPVARAVDGLVERILADVEPGVAAAAGGDEHARDGVGR